MVATQVFGVLLFTACVVMVWVCYFDLEKGHRRAAFAIGWLTTIAAASIIFDLLSD